MDLPLDDSAAKRRVIQDEYKKHHSEKHRAFVSNAPAMQQKEWQLTQQLVHRVRNQPAKQKNPKQYNEMHKQLVNATSEQQNTTKINGGFNNNEILQVRSFAPQWPLSWHC